MAEQNNNTHPDGFGDEVHQPFDVQAQKGQYAQWKLLGALLFLILLALIVFFVYQPGSRDRGDPIVISPNKTALKIPPEENRLDPIKDKTIYGAGSNNTGTSTITVTPEAPIKLPSQVTVIGTTPSIDTTPSQVPQTPAAVAPPPPVQPQPSAPTPRPQQPSTTGQHLVQVASLRSYEEAEATWNRLTKKFTFLRGQPYDIKRVDLNEKGVYYRLRIDGLSSPQVADAVCQRLQANSQACFKTSR